jgi:hypothetical protein
LGKIISYVGGNSIGANGCDHLSKADWKNLTYLYLGKIISYVVTNSIEASK